MKFTKMVAASLLAFASIPAAAQSDVGLAVGATVYGSDAGEVGKIVEVGDGYVIVDTGTHKATLPNSSFGKGAKGPLIGLTKAGLDEFVAKANAEAAAKLAAVLKPQATIQGAAGGDLGTVKSIEADGTVVVTYKGLDTAFPKEQFYANEAGQLALPFTAEQLDQALAPQFEAATKAKAALESALTAGKTVKTSDGVEVGTIRELDAQGNVVVDRSAGAITLPKNLFTADAAGNPALLIDKAALDAATAG